MTELALPFVATYLLHSTLLVGAALLLDRYARPRAAEVRELILRAALFGSVVTAVVATFGTALSPNTGSEAAPPVAPVLDGDSMVVAGAEPAATVAAAASTGRKPASEALEPAVVADVASPSRDAAQPPARTEIALPRLAGDLAAALIAAWLVLGGIALARLASAVRLQRALAQRLPRIALEPAERSLARWFGLEDVALVLDERAGSPYVAAPRVIALPRWAIALGLDERRALLAHEFAHVARRDPAWLVAIDAVRRAFWFQPLAWLAQSRLDALAELACDARAAHALGEGRSLARCLAACAEHATHRHVPRFAPAMARRPSLFLSRVQRLLEDVPMTPRSLLSWKVLLPTAVCTFAFLLPTVIFRAAIADDVKRSGSEHHSISIHESKTGHRSIEFIDSDLGMSAEIDGDVTFNDDESDIVALSDEAEIEQTINGREHQIEFRNESGKVVRRYRVDGKDQPFDANARAWLAQAIPTLLRQTGIDAEKRVQRIHAKRGVDGVIAEIRLMTSDFARREYVSALSEHVKLTPAELDRVVALVGELDSDFERRTSYEALLRSQEFAPAQQAALLQGVARIDSDFEQRTVLQKLIPKLSDDPVVFEAWDKAIGTIGSDFELRSVIASASKRRLSGPMAAATVDATRKIGSDFERRSALISLLRQVKAHPALLTTWMESAEGIGSDYERRSALEALIKQHPLDAQGYGLVLDATESMGSDYERRTVLEDVAKAMPQDAALIAKYRQIAEKMGEYEQSQAMAALGRRAD